MKEEQVADANIQIADFLFSTKEAITNLENDPCLSRSVLDAVETIDVAFLGGGKVITTGLGKAGHAAQKSASSFSSLGIPACYLHPAQASHGDVGVVQAGDVLLAFSTSGKTREVIETIELARKLRIGKVISFTSHEESPVRDLSDIVVGMGCIAEAGYLSIAPTTSIIVMLVLSDMVATMCACRMGLTVEQFGLRHHGGYLGHKCRGIYEGQTRKRRDRGDIRDILQASSHSRRQHPLADYG